MTECYECGFDPQKLYEGIEKHIEGSKQKLNEIIREIKDYEMEDFSAECDYTTIIEKLEKFRDEEL